MANIAKILRRGITILDEQTETIQVTVWHFPWLSFDDTGTSATYDDPVELDAIVSLKGFNLYKSDGRTVSIRATILFLSPIADNGAPGRKEPLDERDKFVIGGIEDGITGPVEEVIPGTLDPTTNKGFTYKVMLGYS